MVKGVDNKLFLNLKERFDSLININLTENYTKKHITNEKIIELIFDIGLDKAMNNFRI